MAVALPYGEFDAMAFGAWSRLLAEHFPQFHFGADIVPAAAYHRPLFFVLQAALWWIFGFHQWLGRLLSFAFSALLIVSVVRLTATRFGRWGRLAAALASVLVVTTTVFARYIAAGLTDMPAAAMVAATALAVLAGRRLGRGYLPLVAVVALLAGLTKPSTFPAVLGLALALLIGDRAGLRRRLGPVAALAAGTLLALAYDEVQAQHQHVGIVAFLRLGLGGAYTQQATDARSRVLLDGGWLGADMRVLLFFAIIYALARVGRLTHRRAVAVAVPLAVGWSWLGPHLSGQSGIRVGILGAGDGFEQAAVVVLAASLLFALAAPADAVPRRIDLARLLVWGAPPFIVWAIETVYDLRLGSTFWPAALVLIGCTVLPALAGAVSRRPLLVALPAAALLVLCLVNVENVNQLGPAGWRQFRSHGISGLRDAALMRDIAYGGDYGAEVSALAPQVGPHETIATTDGRLRFLYLDRALLSTADTCEGVRGHRALLILESDEMRAALGEKATAGYWAGCASPKLTLVSERPGAFALFVSGPVRQAGSGTCNSPPATPGLAIEFGRVTTAAAAAALLGAVTKVGFVQAKVEQLGCASYRVVETGIPSAAVGDDILKEAHSAQLSPVLVTGP